MKKHKTLNFTTLACWIVAMNKKNVFAEFRIKISSSSLPTFYDTFWLIWHYSIHTFYSIQLINKSLTGTLFLPKRISILINHKYKIQDSV